MYYRSSSWTELSRTPFVVGFFASLFLHIVASIWIATSLRSHSYHKTGPVEIFSVTIEGGQKLGGLTQVPKDGAKPEKAKGVPNLTDTAKPEIEKAAEPAVEKPAEKPVEKPLEKQPEPASSAAAQPPPEKEVMKDPMKDPTMVEALEKEKKIRVEREAEELKIKEDEKKKAEAEDRKKKEKEKEKEKAEREAERIKAAEEKMLADEQRKADEKKKKERDRKKREAALQSAVNRVGNSTYAGESVNAGGQDFGSARVTGQNGMGGGTLASAEFIAYRQALELHLKRGWRWLRSEQRLTAVVGFRMGADGSIDRVVVAESSGNSQFDESAVRAVRKASPAPTPSAQLYQERYNKDLTVEFSSEQ